MANKYKNIVLEEKGDRLSYKPVNPRGSESKYPPRDSRVNHAIKIRREFENAWAHATKESNERLAVATQAREGVYLEIKGQVGYDLVTKSLEDQRQGVKLLNVTQDENGVTKAAVFVPNQKREFFIKKINTYQESIKGTEVVGTIESINEAIVDTFWVSTKDSIPAENREWCEVWLAYKQNTADAKMVFEKFSSYCQTQNIPIKSQKIVFPEKIVVGIEANKNDLSAILLSCSNVSEFRKMSAATSFFTSLQTSEQREWIENMSERIDYSEQSNTSICLLDTGVNNAHPLLSELLSDHDMHTIHPEKGVNDTADHGTKMAGLAAYFTLEDKLEGTEPIKIHHFLESVKLLDNPNDNERELYGYCAYKAISLAEIERPYSNRTICIAITTDDSFVKDGRPSSWSGAIDSLTSGANENDIKRLILISAGNTTIEEIREAGDYRVAVTNHSIEDPGQAWNAITVGAYTEKTLVSDETCKGYEPVAKHGGYSPFTSSSLTWDKKWPIKPEIVLEGGNLAYNKSDDFYSEVDNLALLTTGNKFLGKKFFDVFSMTSAATAQAAWIAANIRHNYPDLWPETIRALMIHSASWTKAMLQEVLRGDQKAKKSEYRQLLQTCGYGVPNLERALWCASNKVNLIIEDELQPCMKKADGSIVLNEMHIHTLPWPSDLLLEYGETPVKMRVTLSYFIEPGPGETGWKDKYRYPSCGLKFDVNNETENRDEFTKRISKAMREEDEKSDDFFNDSGRWIIGAETRSRGSIHSDIWEGTAGQLSNSNMIIIYPRTGWWKLRTNLKMFNSKIRYSLVVSIETPELKMNLYNAIQTEIKNKATIKTEITAIKK